MESVVNEWLDGVAAVLWRIAQFPVVFQIFIWLCLLSFFFIALAWIIQRLSKQSIAANSLVVAWSTAALISTFFIYIIILDAKETIRQQESELLQQQILPRREISSLHAQQLPPSIESIGALSWSMLLDTTGVEVYQASCTDPLIQFTMARIDMRMVEIKMDTLIDEKEKTSHFAQMHDCLVAVNGEAGNSPDWNAAWGQWIGNYIVEGRSIFLKDDEHRPFLAFDRVNHAIYSPEKQVDLLVDETKYNSIWGRFDCVVDGQAAVSRKDESAMAKYPRTLMGIDSTGYKLTLIVCDGRMPDHSIGMKMFQCADLMLALDVHDGMACDQGGSSCFYIKDAGIVNKPSDGGERPVYTHFGVKLRN